MPSIRRTTRLENRTKRRREVLVSSIAIMLALVGTTSGLIATLQGRGALFAGDQDLRLRDEVLRQRIEVEKARDDAQRSLLAAQETQRTFLQAAKLKGSVLYQEGMSPEDRAQMQKIASSQDDLNKQLTTLNEAILQTPEKAVAIPVLKQQIGDLQDKYRGDNDAMHAEIGRLYTMMSIFFGSMVALIVGVGGLFFSVFKQRAERHQHTESDNQQKTPPQPPPSNLKQEVQSG